MVFTARKCVNSGLCISKQLKLNTFTIKQHLRDVILSPLSGNILLHEINNNSNKTLVMRDASKGNAQDAGDMQSKLKSTSETISQHLKDEVVSSLSGNIFMNADGEQIKKDVQADVMLNTDVPKLFQTKVSALKINENFGREMMSQFSKDILMKRQNEQKTSTPTKGGLCGKENKMKLQECNFILSPPDGLKGFKCADIGKNKQHFKTNAVPPLSGKISVAMEVRFQINTEMHNEGKNAKIIQKCNPLNSSFNIPKISASSTSACNKPIPCKNQCKPKTK